MTRDPRKLRTLAQGLLDQPQNRALAAEAEAALEEDPRALIDELLVLMPPGYAGGIPEAAAPPAAVARAARREGERFTWRDCIDRRRIQPLKYCTPGSLPELVGCVREAEAAGLRVKAVGSGHSFSNITETTDYLVNTHGLESYPPLDPATLKDPRGSSHLFRAEGGVLIKDLNHELFRKKRALENLGGFTGQTIAGAIATGTHGSGLTLGPLASQVASLQLVTSEGRVLQVEPSDGITKPSAFPGREAGIPVELVQDDETFHALTVAMGCMGVIYSVCLRVRDTYWLSETRTVEAWSDVRRQIADGSLLREWRHSEVIVNPYERHGRHKCLVTKRKEVSPPSNPIPAARERNVLAQLLASVQGDGRALLFLLNTFPQLTPSLLDRITEAMQDELYVDLSHKVFDLGAINSVRAYAVEIAVPLEQAVAATERVFALAAQAAELGQHYNSSPLALRFVAPAAALLAPQFGRATCMIEIICLYGATGAEELLRRYQRALYELGGRPHWGLELDELQGAAKVRALYPDSFDRWVEVYRRLNRKGTFRNAFTERLGVD